MFYIFISCRYSDSCNLSSSCMYFVYHSRFSFCSLKISFCCSLLSSISSFFFSKKSLKTEASPPRLLNSDSASYVSSSEAHSPISLLNFWSRKKSSLRYSFAYSSRSFFICSYYVSKAILSSRAFVFSPFS